MSNKSENAAGKTIDGLSIVMRWKGVFESPRPVVLNLGVNLPPEVNFILQGDKFTEP